MNYKNLIDEDEIIDTFLKLNPIPKGKETKPYLILFDGITGTGKSTVAKIIAKKTGVIVLNNDKVRQFVYLTNYINNPKIDSLSIQKLIKKIQCHRLKQTLKNGNNCLLDGDISNNFENKIASIEKNGFKYFIVKLICDRKKVIERIENRKFDKTSFSINGDETINYSAADINTFLLMESKKYVIPAEYIFFEIDTSKSLINIEKQVEKLIDKLNNANASNELKKSLLKFKESCAKQGIMIENLKKKIK